MRLTTRAMKVVVATAATTAFVALSPASASAMPSRLIPVSTIRWQRPPPAALQRSACSSELITGTAPVARA